jgi:hypothetical protein
MNDDVHAGVNSDAFGVAGWERHSLNLRQTGGMEATITIEAGDASGKWSKLSEVKLGANGFAWVELKPASGQDWVRLRSDKALTKATAAFSFSNADTRTAEAADIFAGLAPVESANFTGGIVRPRGENKRDLHFLASSGGTDIGLYSLDAGLNLRRVDDSNAADYLRKNAAIPAGAITADAASVLFIDDKGLRWRLPRGSAAYDKQTGAARVCREVATERDLFNAYGTIFELPAENAGGFIKARAVATHNRHIVDYCSYRGMFVISGVSTDAPAGEHIVRSDDGKTALWVGAIDDAWKAGKPRGIGGPWMDSQVEAGKPSDAYLATGYDKKRVSLSHKNAEPVTMSVQADITGTGEWVTVKEITVAPGKTEQHTFPEAFTTYWFRMVADKNATATAQFTYE